MNEDMFMNLGIDSLLVLRSDHVTLSWRGLHCVTKVCEFVILRNNVDGRLLICPPFSPLYARALCKTLDHLIEDEG